LPSGLELSVPAVVRSASIGPGIPREAAFELFLLAPHHSPPVS
jgi:hypothetical protein